MTSKNVIIILALAWPFVIYPQIKGKISSKPDAETKTVDNLSVDKNLAAELAPLFSNKEVARQYAGMYQAAADAVERDAFSPLQVLAALEADKTFKLTLRPGLTNVEQLQTIIRREFAIWKSLTTDEAWTPDLKRSFINQLHRFSIALLYASEL